MSKHTVSVEAAAKALNISRGTAYRIIREGTFPVQIVRVGRQIRVPRRALEEILGSLGDDAA